MNMGHGTKTILQSAYKELRQYYEFISIAGANTKTRPIFWEVIYYDTRADAWSIGNRFYTSKEAREFYRNKHIR